METIMNGAGVIPPAVTFNLSPEAVDRLGVSEARSIIRESGIGPKIGIKGTDLVGMNLAACKAVIMTGEAPMGAKSADDTGAALALLIRDIAGNSEKTKTELLEYLESEISQIKKDISNIAPRKLEVTSPKGVVTLTGAQHASFELILLVASNPEINIALVGPAGSGKSYTVSQVSKALGLAFTPVSFNILSSKSDVLGFVDANGVYRASPFYNSFKNGGLFLADEFDACHAGIATILNAAIANRACTFANGETVEAHPDFRFVAAMNTFGSGATSEYVGRNRLDAATLDRFCFISFGYDAAIEGGFAGVTCESKPVDISEGGSVTPGDWFEIVAKYRKAAIAQKIPMIISPRCTKMGAMLAPYGIGKKHLIDMLIVKGLAETDAIRLNSAAGVV